MIPCNLHINLLEPLFWGSYFYVRSLTTLRPPCSEETKVSHTQRPYPDFLIRNLVVQDFCFRRRLSSGFARQILLWLNNSLTAYFVAHIHIFSLLKLSTLFKKKEFLLFQEFGYFSKNHYNRIRLVGQIYCNQIWRQQQRTRSHLYSPCL